jgi:phenylacetate-CoA ligase
MNTDLKYAERLITCLPYRAVERLLEKSVGKDNGRIRSTSPSFFEWVAQKRLIAAFQRAASRVPFYRDYLGSRGVDANKIKTVQDFLELVPPIDKKSYVQAARFLGSLCVDGKVDKASLLTRSSGYSGRPCIWPKSHEEKLECQRDAAMACEHLFQISRYKTLFINACSLGTWVAGVSICLFMPPSLTLCATGPKIEEIIEIVERCAPEYEQIVICGYPPFLKMLVDKPIEAEPGFWKDKSIRFMLLPCGEGFSEGWRGYINQCIGADHWEHGNCVLSAFGAADLGILGISETSDSVRIRRTAEVNSEFAEALFGDRFSTLPMLFAYNPLKYFITTNHKGELEFSTISPHVLVPLIRYNLHDLGNTSQCNEVKQILKSFGLDDQIDFPMPFVHVFGRSTGEISIGGKLIYPENFREALFSNLEVSAQITGRFKMSTEEDDNGNARFYVDIELKHGVADDRRITNRYENLLHNYLMQSNAGYREVLRSMPMARVQVRIRQEKELEDKQHIKLHYT